MADALKQYAVCPLCEEIEVLSLAAEVLHHIHILPGRGPRRGTVPCHFFATREEAEEYVANLRFRVQER